MGSIQGMDKTCKALPTRYTYFGIVGALLTTMHNNSGSRSFNRISHTIDWAKSKWDNHQYIRPAIFQVSSQLLLICFQELDQWAHFTTTGYPSPNASTSLASLHSSENILFHCVITTLNWCKVKNLIINILVLPSDVAQDSLKCGI